MMKKLFYAFFMFCGLSQAFGQQQPFLRVEYRETFIGDRIDIIDGPRVLTKEEVFQLMQTQPEAFEKYQQAMKKQSTSKWLDGVTLLTTVGVVGLSFISPQSSTSNTRNNLIIPMVITTFGLGIASGFYRRSSRNMTKEAVDLYNFSEKKTDPIYFDDGLTYYNIPDFIGFQIRF